MVTGMRLPLVNEGGALDRLAQALGHDLSLYGVRAEADDRELFAAVTREDVLGALATPPSSSTASVSTWSPAGCAEGVVTFLKWSMSNSTSVSGVMCRVEKVNSLSSRSVK